MHTLLNTGHTEVVDADLSGYFDSIPHAELMKSVARRVSDRHMLHLIKMWLEAPVEETDERGRKQRTTRNKDEGRGTPARRSDLAAAGNLYMRRFVLGWKTLGHEQRLQAHIVNYADDFVICCRGTADEAMAAMRDMMATAEADGERDRRRTSAACRTKRSTFWATPSGAATRRRRAEPTSARARRRRRSQRLCREISELTDRDATLAGTTEEMVGRLNRKLMRLGELLPPGAGQQGLSSRGSATSATGSASGCVASTRCRVGDTTRFPDRVPVRATGPDPASCVRAATSRGRTHESLVREPDAGNPPVRFDEREVETEHGRG